MNSNEVISERERLWRGILDNPEDFTLRLVYADWLEEYGTDEDRWTAMMIRSNVYRPHLSIMQHAPSRGTFVEWFNRQGKLKEGTAGRIVAVDRGPWYELYSSTKLHTILKVARENPVVAVCWDGIEPVRDWANSLYVYRWWLHSIAQRNNRRSHKPHILDGITYRLKHHGQFLYTSTDEAFADLSNAIIAYSRSK